MTQDDKIQLLPELENGETVAAVSVAGMEEEANATRHHLHNPGYEKWQQAGGGWQVSIETLRKYNR